MTTDHTIPPVPDAQFVERGVRKYLLRDMERYGHACAEAARAPLAEENTRLLARVAELEALVELYRKQGSEQDNRAWIAMSAECEARGEAIDRLRAELEALRKAGGVLATAVYNATGIAGPLNSAQSECLNNARIRWDAIAARKGEGVASA